MSETRETRLAALLDEFQPDDVDSTCNPPNRFALVQLQDSTGAYWVTTWSSLDDACGYGAPDELDGWGIYEIRDLDTGDVYECSIAIQAKPFKVST